ncbi:uncharacterized protein G2W53_017658 [Senna tora]|uniref:Uncharacterized protein n=1 Tax=Senna tora TaxID=362788 RepID=A0A834TRN0_9FABA|nr:uncharacterized protein G2W53_017658 [Senna tora]
MVISGGLLSDRDFPTLCNDTKLKMTEHRDATKLWCESAKVRRQGWRCDAETEEKNYDSGGWDFGPGEEYGTVGRKEYNYGLSSSLRLPLLFHGPRRLVFDGRARDPVCDVRYCEFVKPCFLSTTQEGIIWVLGQFC